VNARITVFDLRPDMLFRLGDGATVVPLDELERMVRNGPITGYAPWDPASKTATRVWASIGVDGLVLFDRKTRIAHHWARPDHGGLAAALKALKRGGAA
jgi:predicted RNA-binding protein associated with RNAse of E/G family